MRTLNFAKRNFKELIRDPLSLVFEIILPLFLLFIFQQIKVPDETYQIFNFTPGIVIFGFSFITLFAGLLVAKDRSSSFLIRLAVSPMKPYEYILGYIMSFLIIVVVQNILFFMLAIVLGLSFSINIIYAIFVSIIVSILYISLGILIGSLVSDKASGGVGSIVVQLVAFTSGMYFSKEIIGNVFQIICEILPFESSLNIIKGVLNNNLEIISCRNIVVFLMYTIFVIVLSTIIFKKKMTCDDK